MKKTISLAALAISASTSSFALIGPPIDLQLKTYCLDVHTDVDGTMSAESCDQSTNNARSGAQLGENGCAGGQVSLVTAKQSFEQEYPINIRPCLPPNIAQL